MYPVNRLCHLESVVAEICKRWQKHMSETLVNTWHFWVTLGNQAMAPTVKEPKKLKGKKGSNPFVPVTPLALICSLRVQSWFQVIHVCCETDGWFSWGAIDVFLFSLYLCVCVQCYLQPAVPIWWSDLGSIMSPAGVLFRVPHIGTDCPAGDQNPSAAGISYTHYSSEGCGSL